MTVIKTGNLALDQKLRGGIPLGSMSLVEGLPEAGKSVLCQHLAYGSLLSGYGVAYFSSEYSPTGLITQMDSIGQDVSDYYREGKFAIYPLNERSDSSDSERGDEAERMLSLLAMDIENLPPRYRFVVVDSITALANHMEEQTIMAFFSDCKGMCDRGRTIIVVARSYAFDRKTLQRLHVLCDTHLNLRSEQVGAKMVKMLEVHKVRNADLNTSNLVSFEVVDGMGLRIVPGSKVKL